MCVWGGGVTRLCYLLPDDALQPILVYESVGNLSSEFLTSSDTNRIERPQMMA